MDALNHDLHCAFRQLIRYRGVTTIVVLTLAIGIACSTAMFSVVRTVLLAPMPWADTGRLAMLFRQVPGTGTEIMLSEPELVHLSRLAKDLEIAAFTAGNSNLVLAERAEALWTSYVTRDFFATLGTVAAKGRLFAAEEFEPGAGRVVLLSHETWSDVFARDPGVIGRKVRIDGETHEIVGVLPADYPLPTDFRWVGQTQIWRPIPLAAAEPDDGRAFFTLVRWKPGISRAAAVAEVDRLSTEVRRLRASEGEWRYQLEPVADEVAGRVRPALLALSGTVIFVLLIACANVAHLLLAQADRRRRELAVRAALGAGRGRLLRQLFLESLLSALLAGALGVAFSAAMIRWLLALKPGNLPRIEQISIDLPVMGFALLAALSTALLAGLAPAFQASRTDLDTVLRGTAGRGSVAGFRGGGQRRLLVLGEVALAMILLTGAGLLARSLTRLAEVELGFEPRALVVGDLVAPATRYVEDADVPAFFGEVRDRLAALPGVEHVGLTNVVPFWSGSAAAAVRIEGRDSETDEVDAGIETVSPGLLEAMGRVLVTGRDLAASDREGVDGVALVNETLARRAWPESAALGQRLRLGDALPWLRVVGVVRDSVVSSLEDPPPAQVLVSYRQAGEAAGFTPRYQAVMIRASGNPTAVVNAARAVVRQVDPEIPLGMIKTMDEHVAASALARYRFAALVLMVFAGMALVIAIVGIYALFSFLVSRSRQEIGVRLALGARPRDVVRHVSSQGARLAILGLALGVPAALALGRLLESVLFGVEPADFTAFTAAALILLGAALGASYLPAVRAGAVDPVEALRNE